MRGIMDIDDILIEGNEIPIDTDFLESELVSLDQTLPDKLYIIPIR